MGRPVFGGAISDGIYDLGPALGGCQELHQRVVPAHRYSIVERGNVQRVRLCAAHGSQRMNRWVRDHLCREVEGAAWRCETHEGGIFRGGRDVCDLSAGWEEEGRLRVFRFDRPF